VTAENVVLRAIMGQPRLNSLLVGYYTATRTESRQVEPEGHFTGVCLRTHHQLTHVRCICDLRPPPHFGGRGRRGSKVKSQKSRSWYLRRDKYNKHSPAVSEEATIQSTDALVVGVGW